MYPSSLLLLASSAAAFSLPDVSAILPLFSRESGGSNCPSKWNDISKELTSKFLSDGQCNPDARAAIRLIFHECGSWNKAQGAKGGCDGSLVLSSEELLRSENKGLEGIAGYIKDRANFYQTSVADMIVFAGNHAVVTCPGGPVVKTFVGRKDSTTAAPDGLLPDVNAPAADLFKLFQDKGFNEVDLAALLGAHSTSNQFNFNTTDGAKGQPQDSTPGVWDVKYYAETLNAPKGVVVFPSDIKLAAHPTVGKEFKGFVNNQGKWNGKFADAMGRMALFGSGTTDGKGLIDCTGALPRATNAKREMRAMPMFACRH
ncbi:peroxidase [Parastagonospora nodorum]|nr:peroxidase [Parastagonospora nodorum]KAH6179181.1 peroxidase [Parastagonospora nodorum]KAH6373352.1 peroxidase [Parastagonospora nodorum]